MARYIVIKKHVVWDKEVTYIFRDEEMAKKLMHDLDSNTLYAYEYIVEK